MIVDLAYAGRSGVTQSASGSRLGLATNTLREAAYVRAVLRDPVAVREALGALHQVVRSDLKFRPKERAAYAAWLAEQDRRFLSSLGVRSRQVLESLETMNARVAELEALRQKRMEPFRRAKRTFLQWAVNDAFEVAVLLDPVITVHPDEVFFEAFSRDESVYARVGLSQEQLLRVDDLACGTTNVDFSGRLAREIGRMRSYRTTRLDVAPAGLAVATTEDGAGGAPGATSSHREKKIDLPDSWLTGFRRVHGASTMALTRLAMRPVELLDLVRLLVRRRARSSPRALRYELVPGERTRVVLEPWGDAKAYPPGTHVLSLSHVHDGPKPVTVRTWGRRRLALLSRLLPLARSVDVHLAGFGLPSFYVLDLGGLSFTLGLSGWTDNDWTGGASLELLTRRQTGTSAELMALYGRLRALRSASAAELSVAGGLTVEKARSLVSVLCQAGRAIHDLSTDRFRHRDLFFTPFTAKEAATLVSEEAEDDANPQAVAARRIHEAGNVRIIARRPATTGFKLSGSAKGDDGHRVRPLLSVDHEGKVLEGTCTCRFFHKHALTKGPCEHLLALRLAHMARLAEEEA